MSRFAQISFLATVLLMAQRGGARADSWPTSFDFNQGVKLTVLDGGKRVTKEYQPYRGVAVSPAEGKAIVTGALASIGSKATTLGEVYNIVQVVDSVAFNMPGGYEGRDARAVFRQFDGGLKLLSEGGDGLNSQLARTVQQVYKAFRTGTNAEAQLRAWRRGEARLRKMQQVTKDPAVDLIAAALRNDVASGLGAASPQGREMFHQSERDFARATAKVLLQGSPKSPSTASLHTRKGVRAFVDYAQYFEQEMPLVKQVASILGAKGVSNLARIKMIHGAALQRTSALGTRPVSVPGYRTAIRATSGR